MPEPDVEIEASRLLVEWGTVRLAGTGMLRLTSDAVVVDATAGGSLRATYQELGGGAWRTGSLTIHGEAGNATIESTRGLEYVWVQLVQRACPLPELARAHRLLGSRRGGSVDAQSRFLAPLLQARRRLEDETDIETRVALLDASALRERMTIALQTIASDAFPGSHPDRRALEAELEDAMTGFFSGLSRMESAATAFRAAAEPVRFNAWRDWVSTVSGVFVLADAGWAEASRLIPASLEP